MSGRGGKTIFRADTGRKPGEEKLLLVLLASNCSEFFTTGMAVMGKGRGHGGT